MMIVTLRPGEAIQIGPDVRVAAIEVKSGGSARIGVEAPRHVKVLRSELTDNNEEEALQTAHAGRR
jgi:carbon storage regulator